MFRISHLLCAALGSCFVGDTRAGEYAYTCDVLHIYSLQEDGSLQTFPDSPVEKLMKKNSFSVSRETGVLVGNSAGLDTTLAKSTRVMNRGSAANAFEAVADFGEFRNGSHPYQFLSIDEFRKEPSKPFVLMGHGHIVTGTCR